jgi:hypothetical protein
MVRLEPIERWPMKRELLIPEDGKIDRDREGVLEVSLGSLDPGGVALELALLRDELADTLTFRESVPGQGPTVRLRVGPVERRASVSGLTSSKVEVVLSADELEAWLAFFLRYHRDTVAEVDHIDTEAINSARSGEVVDIVVTVATPVSSEEARR